MTPLVAGRVQGGGGHCNVFERGVFHDENQHNSHQQAADDRDEESGLEAEGVGQPAPQNGRQDGCWGVNCGQRFP